MFSHNPSEHKNEAEILLPKEIKKAQFNMLLQQVVFIYKYPEWEAKQECRKIKETFFECCLQLIQEQKGSKLMAIWEAMRFQLQDEKAYEKLRHEVDVYIKLSDAIMNQLENIFLNKTSELDEAFRALFYTLDRFIKFKGTDNLDTIWKKVFDVSQETYHVEQLQTLFIKHCTQHTLSAAPRP